MAVNAFAMPSSAQTAPTATPMASPAPSAAPPTARRVVSPAQMQYLRAQSQEILLNGGSTADVADFLKIEEIPIQWIEGPTNEDRRRVGLVEGLGAKALQGITFGFGDEALGSLIGILSGEGASAGIDNYRRDLQEFSSRHGVAGFLAEMAGSLVTGGALIKGASKLFRGAQILTRGTQGLSIGARAGTTALQGGVAGVASGAGHGEGGFTLEGMSDRAKSALLGGAFGAVAGGALSAGASVVGSVVRPAVRAATRGNIAIQDRIPGVGTPQQHSDELLARAIEADAISYQEAQRRIAEMAATGSPITLADVFGEHTLRLAQDAVALRSPAKQALFEDLLARQSEQGGRLTEDLFRTIFRGNKLGLSNSYAAEEALSAVRSSQAKPWYTIAHQQMVTLDDRMRELLQHPVIRKLYEAGRQIADDEDLLGTANEGALKVPALAQENPLRIQAQAKLESMGVSPARIKEMVDAEFGPEAFLDAVPLRALDYVKQGLDALIASSAASSRALTGKAARNYRAMVNELLDHVAAQSDAYKTGRAIWQDHTRAMEQIAEGRASTSWAPEVVAAKMKELSPFARDFFRVGHAQKLYEDISGISSERADIARRFFGGRLFGNKNNIDANRIRALFPDAPEVGERFLRKVATEARITYTTSRTAARAASAEGVQAAEQIMEGTMPQFARSSPTLAALSTLREGLVRSRTGWNSDVSDELAVAFSRGLDGDASSVQQLVQRIYSKIAMARMGGPSKLGVGTGVVGGIVAGEATR